MAQGIYGGTCPMCCWDVAAAEAGTAGGEPAVCPLCAATLPGTRSSGGTDPGGSVGLLRGLSGGLVGAGALTYILVMAR